jgi:predicted RNA-binding protein with RPS1 domain
MSGILTNFSGFLRDFGQFFQLFSVKTGFIYISGRRRDYIFELFDNRKISGFKKH